MTTFQDFLNEFPCLYDQGHMFFYDRNIRKRAYEALRDKINAHGPIQLTLFDIINKVRNHLRKTRAQSKRINRSTTHNMTKSYAEKATQTRPTIIYEDPPWTSSEIIATSQTSPIPPLPDCPSSPLPEVKPDDLLSVLQPLHETTPNHLSTLSAANSPIRHIYAPLISPGLSPNSALSILQTLQSEDFSTFY